MSRTDIVRAWKDAAYRASLTEAQRSQLPANPAGAVDLTDEEAATVEGRLGAYSCCSSSFHCAAGCFRVM
jgi:mersacidin/lichenicidin family type 2 lantibiotic